MALFLCCSPWRVAESEALPALELRLDKRIGNSEVSLSLSLFSLSLSHTHTHTHTHTLFKLHVPDENVRVEVFSRQRSK